MSSDWRERLERRGRADLGAKAVARFVDKKPPAGSRVTQIGSKNAFHDEPRWHKESELSVIDGALSIEDAVRRQFDRPPQKNDRVRYLSVELMLSHEYQVFASPLPSNDLHCSISAPIKGTSTEEHQSWWRSPVRVTLTEIARDTEQCRKEGEAE